jgi:hypothetical protein
MKKWDFIAMLSILLTGLVYTFVGYRYTFYSVGVYLIPVVLVLSAIAAFSTVLAKNKWRHLWWPIFNSTGSILFMALIAAVALDHYKPTYVIHIPENFEGMVYLFPANEKSDELYIDENGIGYFMPKQEVDVKVLHGEVDISNAMNQYGQGSLQFSLVDSTQYESIGFSCFEVEKGREYGSSPWNQPHAKCMDEAEFKRLVAAGIIDESRIEKKVYLRLKAK